MEYEQSLFDPLYNGNLLNIAEIEFKKVHKKTWQELFSGYNGLFALTYSSDIPFLSKLFSLFDHSEVLFGYPRVVGSQQRTLLDIPCQLSYAIVKGKYAKNIACYMDQGKVSMSILKDLKSHAKLFILEAKDGRHCVINGSANLSTAAMNNFQFEIINIDYSDEGYNYYKSVFESLKFHAGSFDKEDVIKLEGKTTENIDEVLYSMENKKFIGAEKVTINESVTLPEEEINIPTAVFEKKDFSRLTSKEREDIFGKKEKTCNGGYRIVISASNIERQKRILLDKLKKKEGKNTPIMDIDYEKDIITIDGEILNLTSSKDEVVHDLRCIESFFYGYKKLYGDVEQTIYDYYKFMAWFFATPFIPRLRLIAKRKNYSLYYRLPNIGVIYGKSNSGKTNLCEFLYRAMMGKGFEPADFKSFTPSQVEYMRSRHNALPIYFADVDSNKWLNFENGVVKNDDFGIRTNMDIYSCVIICMNREASFNPESKKRCMAIRMDSGFDEEVVYNDSDTFREISLSIGNAFYRMYISRFLKELHKIETSFIEDQKNIEYNITIISSQVILNIMDEFLEKRLFFAKELNAIQDIVGYKVTGKKGIDTLKLLIETSPECFKIVRKDDKMILDNRGNPSNHIALMRKELPNRFISYDNKAISNLMIFTLSEIETLENIDLSHIKGYKLSIIDRVKKIFSS